MNVFDAYGLLAENKLDSTIINGRYDFQKDQEKLVFRDIFEKLVLKKK